MHPPQPRSVKENLKVTESILAARQECNTLATCAHLGYIYRGLHKGLSPNYLCLDASQPWLVFWMLRSLELLGETEPDPVGRSRCMETLRSCLKPGGGFGGSPFQAPHLAPTYAAVMSCCILQDYSLIDTKALYAFLVQMKRPNGSFCMHLDGESDIRATYCAIAVASITGVLTEELAHAVPEHILKCQTFEGGVGACPGAESHGGYTYCALAALCILRDARLCRVDLGEPVSRIVAFCKRMQCQATGAFRGRTNKLVDACYSFWQGACFTLAQADASEWNPAALRDYILNVSQQTATGGFVDKPGKSADYYHTCYALSGLAVCAPEMVPPTDPRYNVRLDRAQAMKRHFLSRE